MPENPRHGCKTNRKVVADHKVNLQVFHDGKKQHTIHGKTGQEPPEIHNFKMILTTSAQPSLRLKVLAVEGELK